MTLQSRLLIRAAVVVPLLCGLIFAPAGSFRFWQGWVFIGQFAIFNVFFIGCFLRRDPGLVERRLKVKEPTTGQKWFTVFWLPLWVAVLVLPGFDYRFGWSERLFGSVPIWLAVGAQIVVAGAWILIFIVFRHNSFASTVVQVEDGQKVIRTGPYRLVRHPMYAGLAMMMLTLGFALGSYLAVVPSLLKIPLLIYRLKDEERVLRKELPGYIEYCARTPWKLIPGLW